MKIDVVGGAEEGRTTKQVGGEEEVVGLVVAAVALVFPIRLGSSFGRYMTRYACFRLDGCQNLNLIVRDRIRATGQESIHFPLFHDVLINCKRYRTMSNR
jgi:hypothetical protein